MNTEDAAQEQRRLTATQTAEFHHDHFVADQLRAFGRLTSEHGLFAFRTVVDVGGGCGHFAEAVAKQYGSPTRVLDADAESIQICTRRGVDAQLADALAPPVRGDEGIVCFNLILHHLVGSGEGQTRRIQVRALNLWRGKAPYLFVNEYIYESHLSVGWSARLISVITASRFLSDIAAMIARWVPSLRANTFGVGVRFRPASEWQQLFAEAGWAVIATHRGVDEPISVARRLMLIRSCRRDSFLLTALPIECQAPHESGS